MAVGSAMPMPAIINPQNAEEYRREREEQEKKEPAFQNVRWSKTGVEEGEEVELNAGVKDIADGNMVTLQVFHEGQEPGAGRALATIPLTVKDGAVSARWSWKSDAREMPPEADPRFIFTAHCAWCNFEKSSNALEVKLVRPEITKVEWHDKDGNSVSKGLVGEVLKLYAETKDVKGGVTFKIYDDKGKQVYSTGAKVEGNKAEAEWTYHYNGEKLDAKPKFKIEVVGFRCKKTESSECEISAKIEVQLIDVFKETISKGYKAVLIYPDNSTEEITFDTDGKSEVDDLIPSKYRVQLKVDK